MTSEYSKLPSWRTLVTILLVSCAAAPHLYRLIMERGSCTDTDDGHQIAAAMIWQETGEYRNLVANPELSEPPAKVRLPNWPPTFSLVVSLFLRAGVPIMWTVLLINLALLLAALAGWYRLAVEFLGDTVAASFALIFVSWRISMYPADLLCCAVAPVLIVALVRILRQPTGTPSAKQLSAVAAMVTVMVAMKYSAVYFIPGVFSILMFNSFRRRGVARDLGPNVLTVLPALIVFALTFSGNTSAVPVTEEPAVEEPSPWQFKEADDFAQGMDHYRLLSLPVTTFFLDPFKLNSVIRRTNPLLAGSIPLPWRLLIALQQFFLIGLIVGALILFARKSSVAGGPSNWYVTLFVLATWCAIQLIAVDVGRGDIGHVRTYRYYSPIAPVLIVVFVGLIRQSLRRRSPKSVTAAATTVILLLPLSYWIADQTLSIAATPNIQYRAGIEFVNETVSTVRGTEPGSVFGHIGTFCQVEPQIPNVGGRDYWDDSGTTRPTWVFLALNRHLCRQTYIERIEGLAEEFQMHAKEWNGWEVYYRRFDEGRLRDSPAGTQILLGEPGPSKEPD